jgi:lipopolysaccharide export system permease protein
MKTLDRYILRQLLYAFAFFALVFTGVVWLTQAVRLIDTVVSSRQSVAVFGEFSLLVLPQVFLIVLPLAGIGGTLYASNRLYVESELVVMMSAGHGPLGLLRPVAMFGLLLMLGMGIVTTQLIPFGYRQLAERTAAIQSDLATGLMVERQFIHPASGITLFITTGTRGGEMSGIFLHDQRDASQPVTYSAERAVLLRDDDSARLVMADGVALGSRADGPQINTVRFDQFVFDLSDLLEPGRARNPRPAEYGVAELLNPTAEMLRRGNYTMGSYVAEGHFKLVLPVLAMLYPLIALTTLLTGSFRRGGFGRRVIAAIAVAVLLYAMTFVGRTRAQNDPALWPLMYLPIVLGFAYIGVLTYRLSRGRLLGAKS